MFCSFVLQTTFISYSGGNHLSTDESSSVLLFVHFLRESAPTIIWVSRSWGLPRSTLFISKKATSLWHFQSIHTISNKRLRYFPCRQVRLGLPALAYDLARHEHYRHRSLCEHGLSSTYLNAAITRTLLMITVLIIIKRRTNSNSNYFYSYNLLPKTCFSRLDNLFKISKLVVPAV
jgi:hypothetical protein